MRTITTTRHRLRTLGTTLASAALVALAAAATSASAAVVTFTDRASWEAAAGGYTETSTFPAIAQYSTITSLTLDDGTTLGFDRSLEKRTVGFSWATWSGGYTGDVFYSIGNAAVEASLSPVFAFGLEMEPSPFSTHLMSVTLSDGSVISQPVTGEAGADFFGWVGNGVTGFTMTSPVDFAFGRFVSAQAQNIPEPATIALLGIALLGIGAGRYHRAKQTVS